MQSLSSQPTLPGSLVVPPPLKELHEQFLGFFGSLCGTLLMFNSPQAKHKHLVEHQDCVYHKDHGHTTEQCISLHYLVERLIRVGPLKQYIHLAIQTPTTPVAPKAIINYIHKGPTNEKYKSKQKRQNSIQHNLSDGDTCPVDDTITFPPKNANRVLQPHEDALILTLGITGFDVRRVLIDSGSSTNLFHNNFPKKRHISHPGGLVTMNVQFSMVEDLSPFNAIMGHAWLHSMKVIPSTYHQMVSYLIKDSQIDFFGSQLAAHRCYQVALESGLPTSSEPRPEPSTTEEQ
ncbi:hypothetical protein AAG906_003739 [Vitis piasezkii]